MTKKIYISESNFIDQVFSDVNKEIKNGYLEDGETVYEIIVAKKYKVSCKNVLVEVKNK